MERKEAIKTANVNSNERLIRCVASESFFGSTIACSNLTVANTDKILIMAINKPNSPKSSGEYILDNKGEIIIGRACPINVPEKRVATFFENSDLIPNNLNILYQRFSLNFNFMMNTYKQKT